MKLKLFMPTTSIAGGLFMLKRTIKKIGSRGVRFFHEKTYLVFNLSMISFSGVTATVEKSV